MAEPRAFESTPVVPKPAATIILLRDGDAGLEVLLLQKASGKHFAAGAMVFPGGKVEPADIAFAGATPNEDPFATLKIAAVREMYEECGLMLARRHGAARVMSAAEIDDCRESDPTAALLELAKSVPLELAIDQLVRFAHWITPPSRPKRFDTHFFIAPAPDGQATIEVDGYEIVDANWRRPADILDEVNAGLLKLVLPTLMNILKLSNWSTVDEAMAAARDEIVVEVTPKRIESDEGIHLHFPAEAGYGVTRISTDMLRSA
jgi:8-oxo-dGTP pyrophosphatase MutT (NUDIX family)